MYLILFTGFGLDLMVQTHVLVHRDTGTTPRLATSFLYIMAFGLWKYFYPKNPII